jgi:hypothetical protein
MKEIPMIEFTLWTQKNLRQVDTINKFKEIMAKRDDIFQPTAIYGGKLTKKRNKVYDISNEEDVALFSKCMLDEDVLRIVLTNSDRKKRETIFGFTIAFVPQFTVISFEVAHSFFKTKKDNDEFLLIIKQMIEITNPMFANIDDIGNTLDIMYEMGEDIYQLQNHIPAIFWGNYFGEKYIEQYGKDKLLNAPYGNIERVGNGIMITMTNDLMEFSTPNCVESRKKLNKYLGIGKYKFFKKKFKN